MTAHDDPSARTQVTLRLERDLLEQVDAVASAEGVDRTELARRLLAEGLARHRTAAAVSDYAAGRSSAWAAADSAGISLYEMLDRIAEAGVRHHIDPETLEYVRGSGPPPGTGTGARAGKSRDAGVTEEVQIAELRERYRPGELRLLFVGESSPAGGTHFYRADSILFRATREAFGRAFKDPDPPGGSAFLEWFQSLGCWLVDLADRPVNRDEEDARRAAVDAGIPGLAGLIADARPGAILVVVRRVASAVRHAAQLAGYDDRRIDVLPFPVRQWRSAYVEQLARIVAGAVVNEAPVRAHAIAEPAATYGAASLDDAMAEVLRRHPGQWLKATAIATEIAADDVWRRPSDDRPPRGSQISARARRYPDLFQVSDLGIRLRD
jgi:hypothetical protein